MAMDFTLDTRVAGARRPLALPPHTAIAPSWQMLALAVRPVISAVLAGPKPTILGWPYHIGTHGKPWGVDERKQWVAERVVHRSYKEEVVAKIDALRERSEYEVLEYGALSHDASRYPLYAIKTRDWDASKPAALVSVLQPAAAAAAPASTASTSASASIQAQVHAHAPPPRQVTGGVHGYETSGVQGALLFLQACISTHAHARMHTRTAHARHTQSIRSMCAVLPTDGGRGVRSRLQPAGRALRQPVGVRDHTALERAGSPGPSRSFKTLPPTRHL